MRHAFPRLLFILSLSLMIILTGCGSSKKTSTTGSTPQTTAAADSVTSAPAQNQLSSDPAQAKPSVSASGSERMSVSWVDAKSDVLSPSDDKPDGLMDGHFHLSLQLPNPVSLESIFIRYSGFEKELRWDGIYNSNLIPAGYHLGVYENGTLILPAPDTGLKRSGQVDLELFAAGLNNAKGRDTLSFDPGEKFQIEINYAEQTGERKRLNAELTTW